MKTIPVFITKTITIRVDVVMVDDEASNFDAEQKAASYNEGGFYDDLFANVGGVAANFEYTADA